MDTQRDNPGTADAAQGKTTSDVALKSAEAGKPAQETAAKEPFQKTDEAGLWQSVRDHRKIIMPAALLVCVAIVMFIAVSANKSAGNPAGEQAQVAEDAAEEASAALELNAYPEINEIVNRFFTARAEGDIATIEEISEGLTETLKLRYREISGYIESYPVVDVYTRKGLLENTFIAYVSVELKFRDWPESVPGMDAVYICSRDDGSYYINFGDTDEAVTEYVNASNHSDEVIDLNNKIADSYNTMYNGDEAFRAFIDDVTQGVDRAVAQALATNSEIDVTEAVASVASTESTGESAETVIEQTPEETAEGAESLPETIRATTVVNVRSAASAESSPLGKVREGDTFTRLSEEADGWSKIEYNGQEAFVKSEFFEVVQTQTASAGGGSDAAGGSASEGGSEGTETASAAGGSTAASADSSASASASSSAEGSSASSTAGSSESSTAGSSASSTAGSSAQASSSAATGSSASSTAGSSASSAAGSTVFSVGRHTMGTTCRLREEPNTDCRVIATCFENDPVQVLEEDRDGWSKVKYAGYTGYIKTEFIKD